MNDLPKDIVDKFESRNLQIDAGFKSELRNRLMFMEGAMASNNSKQTRKFQVWNLFKYNAASIAALFALVVLVGGASAIVSTHRTKENAQRETAIPQDLAGLKSVDDIRAIAQADVPAGKIVAVELEKEDNGLVYKVQFADGSIRLYDARTGSAVVKAPENDDDTISQSSAANITLQQARDIAQAKRPGKIINKIELETEEGKVVYSVRFSDGGRVDVVAASGAVVRVEGGSGSDDSSGDDQSTSSNDDSSGTDDSSGSSSTSGSGSGHDDGGSDSSGHGGSGSDN